MSDRELRQVLCEVIGELDAGRLVPREDPADLRATLRDLLSSPKTLQEMGWRAEAYGGSITRESQIRAIVQRVAPEWLDHAEDSASKRATT